MDNKQMDTARDQRAQQDALPQDLPLDPAVERVRKKLMRLMIISIAITLILMLAVLFGIVYKIIATRSVSKQTEFFASHSKNKKIVYHTLSLPKNTQILSQSLSEQNLVLKILTSDGQTKFMVYNYYTGALIAILSVETTEEKTTNPSS
ncbi:hypothetical protein [Bartonella birtlesii]|uniref:Uncharacterized protein n=1 Tax=Bartonella birtlesii LL-WM9 TaxID=1094552 RepID=J1IZJ9_9HYPH|nr:hypothetical protein [Bartonella birtlesii]EJF76750.1 hypothetical protein ME7_00782 [Bartonella birtlesii LL-WM9]